QYVVKNLYGRSVELDIHAREKNGRRFNVEVQREGKGARPRRARYHASLLDASSIKSGKKVERLPENYVIFITEKDYFGCGEPIYHIDRVVQEKNIPFGDGSHILYVNGAYEGDDAVGHLMHDFRCSNTEDMHSDVLRETAKYFKETKEGQRKVCKVWDEIRQEGIDMGKEIGKEIGLKSLVRTVKSFVDDFEGVYNAVINNEEYKDFTREDVMKYYV
ncbi:MAG: PD-(D/E)XK nuclease family transposase, partial [Lachnospiraceae bacterium]|nr:PD-(D/E)XK nuclease family transposase [Lachnospiraceae bacterium]